MRAFKLIMEGIYTYIFDEAVKPRNQRSTIENNKPPIAKYQLKNSAKLGDLFSVTQNPG